MKNEQTVPEGFWKKFYKDRDHTGRYVIVSERTGIKYAIEPVTPRINTEVWGDLDPASGKILGSYGKKYQGSIDAKESLITEENGFRNIIELEKGVSPEAYIDMIDAQKPDKLKML